MTIISAAFRRLWNLAAFYLFVLEPPPWIAAAALVGLAVLTFAPISFLHPLRVRRLRTLNIALLGAWGALALLTLAADLAPGPYVTVPLTIIGVYFLIAGAFRKAA